MQQALLFWKKWAIWERKTELLHNLWRASFSQDSKSPLRTVISCDTLWMVLFPFLKWTAESGKRKHVRAASEKHITLPRALPWHLKKAFVQQSSSSSLNYKTQRKKQNKNKQMNKQNPTKISVCDSTMLALDPEENWAGVKSWLLAQASCLAEGKT